MLNKMKKLLPYLAAIPHDDSTAAFWQASEKSSALPIFSAMLQMFKGDHAPAMYGIVSALTGKRVQNLHRQSFAITCRELLTALDEDILLLIRIVNACGIRPVMRVIYTYNPSSSAAIPDLILMDQENLQISLYQCDMLRLIVGMFAQDGRRIPTIRELIGTEPRKKKSSEYANEFIAQLIDTFKGGTDEQQETE